MFLVSIVGPISHRITSVIRFTYLPLPKQCEWESGRLKVQITETLNKILPYKSWFISSFHKLTCEFVDVVEFYFLNISIVVQNVQVEAGQKQSTACQSVVYGIISNLLPSSTWHLIPFDKYLIGRKEYNVQISKHKWNDEENKATARTHSGWLIHFLYARRKKKKVHKCFIRFTYAMLWASK